MKQLLHEKFCSGLVNLGGGDVQANFDNSFILYVNKIDFFFKYCFILSTKQFSLWNLRGKKLTYN